MMGSSRFNQSLAISLSILLVSCAPGPVGTQATKPVVQQPVKQPTKKISSSSPPNPNLTPDSKGTKSPLAPDSKGNKLNPNPPDNTPPSPDTVAPAIPKHEDKAQTIAELLKKEESELTNLTIPVELDEEKANALELGEQPDAASKDKIKAEVAQKLKNNTFAKVKVKGQLELPATGFKTQQSSPTLVNYIVQLYGPDGTLLAETTSDNEGKYSFENIPSGIRVEIVAFPPFAFSNRMTAMVDIPPATSPDQSIPSNVSSRSTALMRVVRSAKRRGNSNIDRVPVSELEKTFKNDIDAVDQQMKLTLNQQVMTQLRNDSRNSTLQATLRQGRSKQARAIRKAAQIFRKASFEDSSLQTLDKGIITSPVVLRGSVTFDAVEVLPPTNLTVVRLSTTTIEIQWDFANAGNHSYKVFLNGQLKAQNYTRHIFKFSDLNPDTAYTMELQTITDSGESGKVSLKASTTAQGSTGTGNFGGGGDTGSDSNPTTTTTTTTTTTATDAPSITSLTPNNGAVGDTVTITGTDFDATTGNNTVKYGTTTATVTAATTTSLTVTVPAGLSTGATNVTVEVGGQTSAASTFTVNPSTVSGDFQVNSYTTGGQAVPQVAMDSDGDFVITWESYNQDGDRYGIFAQRYSSAGVTQGSEFQVNTYTTNHQNNPDIAMDDNGNFVITWHSSGQDGNASGIIAKRYDSAGVAQGSEFQVNTYTTSSQQDPSIAMDSDGDFVITWKSQNQDGSNDGVYAQRFDSSGATVGSEFQVNTYTTGSQDKPAVAMDGNGNFVISWQSFYGNGSDNYHGIYARRYNSSGTAQGSEFQVNTYFTNKQKDPAIAMDSDGDFVISWSSYNQDGNDYGIYAQRYNSAGAAQGSEFQVNTYTTDEQRYQAIAMDSDGDFVISWFSIGQDRNTIAQRFNSSGVAQGSEFQVNTYTTGNQFETAIAMDSDGDFVTIWTSRNQINSDDIFAQRYNSNGIAQ